MANKIVEDMEIETGKYLQDEVKKLNKKGVKVSSVMREGPVPDTILAVAEETHADVIAMSTHGRSGVSRWVYGSVAEKVLRGAHCPTLIVRRLSMA